jgi:acetate kinase
VRILVVNCGSSSLKYTFFDGDHERAAGLIEKIGESASSFSRRVGSERRSEPPQRVADHAQAIGLMMDKLVADGVIPDASAIEAVGHRVVHGGPDYTDAALVDDRVRGNRVAMELAPLHRPNYVGIEACVQRMPGTPQVAVFDTAFHQTMPPKAYHYALPYRCFEKYQVRRYGFHGTSHKYVSGRAARLLKRPARRVNLITLHLGNGSSLAAVAGGRCVDTSMGLTPLAGVVMGSRCGDIDPAIVPFLMEREGLDPRGVDQLLNKQSGILGLSGVSNDLREVITQAKAGHARARLALEVFAYSIQKYVGAYTAVLGRVDALVFTAGIGERSPYLRDLICRGLGGLGVKLDARKNRACVAAEAAIHAAGSKVRVWVVPTREEYMIARETERVVSAGVPAQRNRKN